MEYFVSSNGELFAQVRFLSPANGSFPHCPTIRRFKLGSRDLIPTSDILEGPLDVVKRQQDYFVVDFPLHLEGN